MIAGMTAYSSSAPVIMIITKQYIIALLSMVIFCLSQQLIYVGRLAMQRNLCLTTIPTVGPDGAVREIPNLSRQSKSDVARRSSTKSMCVSSFLHLHVLKRFTSAHSTTRACAPLYKIAADPHGWNADSDRQRARHHRASRVPSISKVCARVSASDGRAAVAAQHGSNS